MTKMITELKDLYGFLAIPGVEVMKLAFPSDDVVDISWKYCAEEAFPNMRHTNEINATYFTAVARIHLCHYLDRLEENAIYCDTDSVIHCQPKRDGTPQIIETWDKLVHDL